MFYGLQDKQNITNIVLKNIYKYIITTTLMFNIW